MSNSLHLEEFSVTIFLLIFTWNFCHSYSEAECNDFPVINNARLLPEGRAPPFKVNETLKFICDTGYTSTPRDPKVTCVLEDDVANWTQADEVCKIVHRSCNDPGFIENARRIGNLFTYPNSITYVCNEGYRMRGSTDTATRYCSLTGQWIPNRLPSCEAIVCPLLAHPENGKVISAHRRLHSVAKYECYRNFNLSGNSERICMEDGTWSGSMPTCKEIICLSPGTFKNMRVIPEKHEYKSGDVIIFRCASGAHQSSKCSESGEWSVRPPICPDVDVEQKPPEEDKEPDTEENVTEKQSNICDDPGTIKNGERAFVGLSVNSTVTYNCHDGYELRGKAVLLCLENGKWDLDKLPICVKPIDVPTIIGIVIGVLIFLFIGIGGYLWYRWREKKIRGYGKEDATDLQETAILDKCKKPIPVTDL